MAGQNINKEALKILWIWAEETLINPKVLKDFLVSTEKNGHTAWKIAAVAGSIDTLEALWICSKLAEINTEIIASRKWERIYCLAFGSKKTTL